jgi:hypothetical protein
MNKQLFAKKMFSKHIIIRHHFSLSKSNRKRKDLEKIYQSKGPLEVLEAN